MYSFPSLKPVCCSMSGSNCCPLTCTQISQEVILTTVQKGTKWKTAVCSPFWPTNNLSSQINSLLSVSAFTSFGCYPHTREDFPDGSDSKESACNAGDPGLTPVLGRFPGEKNDNSFQYSCLDNPMDRPWGCKESHMTDMWHTHTIHLNGELCLFPHLSVLNSFCLLPVLSFYLTGHLSDLSIISIKSVFIAFL